MPVGPVAGVADGVCAETKPTTAVELTSTSVKSRRSDRLFMLLFVFTSLIKQSAEPAAVLVLIDHLSEFAGIEPNAVAFVADIDLDVLVIGFEQSAVTARTTHPGVMRVLNSEMAF